MVISLAAMLGMLLAAALAHMALRRASQRVDGSIGRRRRQQLPLGAARIASLALLLAQWGVWLAALSIGSRAHPALAALREQSLAVVAHALDSPLFSLSGRAISALDLLLLPVALATVWLAVNGLTHLLRASLLRALGLESGSEETAASLLRYALAFIGLLVALELAGLDVRGLAIAGGVLGLGIGFGLQNIANNFVSGVLIGLERPVRAGDFVRVGEHLGTVVRVGARSTSLRTLDRVTVLIPNSRFLESEVVNWSYGDPTSRVHVPVGVDYGSDVSTVRAALLAAARSHPAVLREPRPQVQMRAFGGSSLEFELLVFTRDPKNQLTLISDLNFRIEAELDRHGVRVPFPQLDVHLRTPGLAHAVDAIAEKLAAGAPRSPALESPARGEARTNGADREERGPEDWTADEVETAALRMRSEGGVPRSDRRHGLRVYRDCFVGGEAVAWLAKNEGLSRAEAEVLGERLVELGHVRHVLDEHGFRDGRFFYEFLAREPRA